MNSGTYPSRPPSTEIDFLGDLSVELILPPGTPPDRPLLDILKASRDTLSNRLSI